MGPPGTGKTSIAHSVAEALHKKYVRICLGGVRDDLEAKGYSFLSAEVEYVPTTYTKLTNEDDINNMTKMLDMFDDNDDVQNVWHNWEMD